MFLQAQNGGRFRVCNLHVQPEQVEADLVEISRFRRLVHQGSMVPDWHRLRHHNLFPGPGS